MKLANATLFIGVCGVDGSAATRGSIAYLPGGSDGNARAPPPPANVTRVNLDANTESVSAAIDTGLLAGAVTLVWQDGAIAIRRYWDAEPAIVEGRSLEEWAEIVQPVLEDAIL